jgi:hypothetical protein
MILPSGVIGPKLFCAFNLLAARRWSGPLIFTSEPGKSDAECNRSRVAGQLLGGAQEAMPPVKIR